MSARLPKRRPRGFTLLELIVSSAITLTIMAAVAATLIGVQGAYQGEAQVKGAVESGRTALSYLERTLALSGYGIPADQAFDFATPGSATKDNTVNATADFVTDDLAVRFRDPQFLRRGTLNGVSVSLSTPLGVELRGHQGIVVACRGGRAFALARTSAGALPASTTSFTVGPHAGTSLYTPPGISTTDRCFTNNTPEGMPYVMLMQERRFRVIDLGGRPFLVVFHNLRDPDPATNPDYEPLAADVEQFQVAYGMNRPSPLSSLSATVIAPDVSGNGNWMLLDAENETTLPSTTGTPPSYSTPYDDALRYSNSAANIRSVRVSMVLRSSRESESRRRMERERLENAPPWPQPPDRFYRYTVRSTLRTPNLNSRTFFTPPVRIADSDAPELNRSGG